MNNELPNTAEAFSIEADLCLDNIDPDGKRLEIKWKSILSLQKKITNYEEKVQGLEEELAKCSNGKPISNANLEDLYLPKMPAKF